MEEKEVKFNIVRMEDDENLQIGVTSDIDDFPDYLEIDEYVAIIATIMAKCINHIIGVDKENYIAEDFDEDNDEHQEIANQVHDFTEALLQLIINVSNNTMRDAFNEEPEEIESCTVVLEDSGDNTHQPRETYYSDNLNIFDPLQSIFPLCVDALSCALDNNMSKQDAKTLISNSLNLLKNDLFKLIDKY